MTPPQPWERQPGEPDRAWSAFLLYRSLPPSSRSLARLVTAERAERTLKRLSSRWRWVARASAYDRGEQSRGTALMTRNGNEEGEARGVTCLADPALERWLDGVGAVLRRVREHEDRGLPADEQRASLTGDAELADAFTEWLDPSLPGPRGVGATESLEGALLVVVGDCLALVRRLCLQRA